MPRMKMPGRREPGSSLGRVSLEYLARTPKKSNVVRTMGRALVERQRSATSAAAELAIELQPATATTAGTEASINAARVRLSASGLRKPGSSQCVTMSPPTSTPTSSSAPMTSAIASSCSTNPDCAAVRVQEEPSPVGQRGADGQCGPRARAETRRACDLPASGSVLRQAVEVLRPAGARCGVQDEAVPRVAGDGGRPIVMQRAGDRLCRDGVTAASSCDVESRHETQGYGCDYS